LRNSAAKRGTAPKSRRDRTTARCRTAISYVSAATETDVASGARQHRCVSWVERSTSAPS
jgi:hypothetical protein